MDLKYFFDRATVRDYSEQDLDINYIDEMIEAASHAPTTGGMQLYSVVITRDKAMKEKLAPCHFNQPMVMTAPVVLTFCADFNRFVTWCKVSKADPGYDNFQSLMSAILDVTIFAQQFNTIAEMNGLGCCYLGTTTYNAKEIAEVLNLPNRVVPIITLTVGYPKQKEQLKTDRLPLEGIIHQEHYHEMNAQKIKKIYKHKESLEINKAFVKENNKETLAQVFTDVRYPKETNEIFSKKFLDYLKEQKYL
ncbi:MAG: nitroreductase family protein [Muribaculaceae bacterium]|nr:nitroreductase family protein [Muribaculaceae bacterium]MBR6432582.1 nitroreductase family protein [Muribaculaceae bacterium]